MISKEILQEIEAGLQNIPSEDFSFVAADRRISHDQKRRDFLNQVTSSLDEGDRRRVWAEFTGYGPIEKLMADPEITEIMINGPSALWIEKSGQLFPVDDAFCSNLSFRNCIERICEVGHSHITVERPSAQGNLAGFRVQVVGPELTRGPACLCLRRHPENPWTLQKLAEAGWASNREIEILRAWIHEGKNFLVIGATGSGKTSVLNACLQELPDRERALILEDTQELHIPNFVSQRFLVREDCQRILPDISLADLVRQSLRMRPDRLVIGEIRGGEARDFLMALSTGHRGSFGSLHASTPHQGLLRLEMLVQIGAPNWNLHAIRRLIQLSLQSIVVVGREGNRRVLQGLYDISALEEAGFLVERV